jgi:hypothetical protein
MHSVVKALYLSGYRMRLTFEDGATRDVDLEAHLQGEVFLPLRNLRRFRRFRVDPDLDTVVWENGADLSPDFLYEEGVPVQGQSRRSKARRGRARKPRSGRPAKPAPSRTSTTAAIR